METSDLDFDFERSQARSWQAQCQPRCTCGRFAIFVRYGPTYPPMYETPTVVNCSQCGEVEIR